MFQIGLNLSTHICAETTVTNFDMNYMPHNAYSRWLEKEGALIQFNRFDYCFLYCVFFKFHLSVHVDKTSLKKITMIHDHHGDKPGMPLYRRTLFN